MAALTDINFETAEPVNAAGIPFPAENLYFTQVALAESAGNINWTAGTIGAQDRERKQGIQVANARGMDSFRATIELANSYGYSEAVLSALSKHQDAFDRLGEWLSKNPGASIDEMIEEAAPTTTDFIEDAIDEGATQDEAADAAEDELRRQGFNFDQARAIVEASIEQIENARANNAENINSLRNTTTQIAPWLFQDILDGNFSQTTVNGLFTQIDSIITAAENEVEASLSSISRTLENITNLETEVIDRRTEIEKLQADFQVNIERGELDMAADISIEIEALETELNSLTTFLGELEAPRSDAEQQQRIALKQQELIEAMDMAMERLQTRIPEDIPEDGFEFVQMMMREVINQDFAHAMGISQDLDRIAGYAEEDIYNPFDALKDQLLEFFRELSPEQKQQIIAFYESTNEQLQTDIQAAYDQMELLQSQTDMMLIDTPLDVSGIISPIPGGGGGLNDLDASYARERMRIDFFQQQQAMTTEILDVLNAENEGRFLDAEERAERSGELSAGFASARDETDPAETTPESGVNNHAENNGQNDTQFNAGVTAGS